MTTTHPLILYTERTGKTVSQIAKAAGCSRMTLYRLVKGEQNATIDLLQRVSAATDGAVTTSDLLPAEQVRA
jgi:transcriptional regulator with XRE-family HTH domain